MINQFIQYQQSSYNEIVGVEAEFSVVVGRALIRCSVDRLEVTSDGALYVIDFNTGGTALSKQDSLENKQMQAYQLAIVEGGFAISHPSTKSAGAELVYLGTSTKEASKRSQPPIDPDLIRAEVIELADGMGANNFLAMINKRCVQCSVRTSCPIQSDGRTVIG